MTIENLGGAALHTDARAAEVEAAGKLKPFTLTKLRLRVLSAVVMHPQGITGSEVAAFTGLWVYTAKPRLTELSQAGYIKEAGLRPNDRGNSETIWVATGKAA